MNHTSSARTALVSFSLRRGSRLMGVTRCGSARGRRGVVSAVGGALLMSCVWVAPAAGATSWTTPQPLSPAGVTAVNPQVAAAANGDATVVWAQRSPSGIRIMSSSRTDGGSWGEPEKVSALGASRGDLQVAMNARVAVAVWKQHGTVMVARRAESSVWTRPRALAAAHRAPQVAIDRRGDITVVWSARFGKHRRLGVFAVRRPVGGHWGPTSRLSGPATGRIRIDAGPQVAMDGRGDTTVTWVRSFVRRSSTTRSWLPGVRFLPVTGRHRSRSERGSAAGGDERPRRHRARLVRQRARPREDRRRAPSRVVAGMCMLCRR